MSARHTSYGRHTRTNLSFILKSDSIFLGEGKAILIEEFGKDYGVYFSILSAIARGKTSRSEIEERYFRRVLIGRQAYTRIGGWWDRKGENEIDIVAENELDEEATFFEVKRKADNIDMETLEHKAAAFLRATGEFKGYKISYKGLSSSFHPILSGIGGMA